MVEDSDDDNDGVDDNIDAYPTELLGITDGFESGGLTANSGQPVPLAVHNGALQALMFTKEPMQQRPPSPLATARTLN